MLTDSLLRRSRTEIIFSVLIIASLLFTAGWISVSYETIKEQSTALSQRSIQGLFLAAQATRTPTPKFMRTPTPTPTKLTSRLRGQVFFAVGGGGLVCSNAVSESMRLPAVAYEKFRVSGGRDFICLYGFQPGETVRVKIFDPRNRQVLSAKIYIQDRDVFGYGFPVNSVILGTLPNNAPAGEWRVMAEGSGIAVENRFYHPGSYDKLTINKAVASEASWYDPRRLPVFVPGNTLLLQGVNFPANQEFAVALYRNEDEPNLMSGQSVRTRSNGSFEAGFAITNAFSPGEYYAVVVVNPDQETYTLDDDLIHFNVLKPYQACSGAMPTIIKKGDMILVSGGPPNNVREKPGLGSRLLGQVFEYEKAEIIAGPKCADGMVWWKIYSIYSGLDGWTAEGKNGDYWLSLLY
jgi:hypothetical protein